MDLEAYLPLLTPPRLHSAQFSCKSRYLMRRDFGKTEYSCISFNGNAMYLRGMHTVEIRTSLIPLLFSSLIPRSVEGRRGNLEGKCDIRQVYES